MTCNVILFVVWWLDRKSPKGYYVLLKDSDEDAFTLLGKKQSKSIWFLARDGNGKKKIRHLCPVTLAWDIFVDDSYTLK